MLLRRIVLLYIVLLLCRIVFYCYNYAPIGPLGWQEVPTLAGGSEVRHRIGSLRQSAFHRPLAAAVPFPGAELVSAYSLLVLCGDQFAADRGRKPGRLRLFPLHAEAFHLRRNLLHRQLQFGTARAEIRRRKLVPAPRRRSPHLAARLGLRTQDHTPIAPARGLGLLLGQYGTAGDRHSARHRRHAGRRNAHDPPDHPLERHALRLDQRKGQPRSRATPSAFCGPSAAADRSNTPATFRPKNWTNISPRPTAPTLRP